MKKKSKKKAGKRGKKPEIKRRVEERVSTGIESLNKFTEGGFEKNSVNLLVGSSGSGKSIFAVQFLIEGIKKGEKCLYVTFEEKKEEFFSNMIDFGWDLEKLEKEEKFLFLEYSPEKVRTMLEEGGGSIESMILRKKISRIVIDSITSFELLFDDELEKREAALELFGMLRKWNCTSLLTYEKNLFMEKRASSETLEFESDSIILLYFIREKKERERYIEIIKMRSTKHSRKIYPVSIGKKGISISEKAYTGKIGD